MILLFICVTYFFKLLSLCHVLKAISKLKLKNSKNRFSNLVLYLPAYS